jgi:glycosyltransferase involved in cell wall biosynthesis
LDFCVVIPAYNAGRTLARAVESALKQTYPPSEIAVVDDGSTDEIGSVMEPYLGLVNYIRTPHRGLPAAARNRGIAETRAQYVAFLDADDWWYPSHLECARKSLANRPAAGLCYGNFKMLDEQGRVIRRVRSRSVGGTGYSALLTYNFICTSTVVVQRACLDRVGTFSEEMDFAAGCEDWELWLRIARHYPIVHVSKALVAYQVHESNGSLTNSERWFVGFEAMSRMILEQVDLGERRRVACWHDFGKARWHLARGHLDEARRLMDQSIRTFRAADRRLVFWLLTREKWALRLPPFVRYRLGIATRPDSGSTNKEGARKNSL